MAKFKILDRIKNFKPKKSIKATVIVLGLLILALMTIAGLSYVTLEKGNYYFNNGNFSEAYKYYKKSFLLSFRLNNKAESRMNKSQEEGVSNQQNKIGAQALQTVSLDKISITGKKVIVKYPTSPITSQIMPAVENISLSAIVKNNTDIGIPIVKIKKAVLYDKNHNQVAIKTDISDTFPLVSQGEFPFSLTFYIQNSNQMIDVKDFDIELEIPPFMPNKNVVRLKTSNLVRVSTETDSMEPEAGNVYTFEYRATLTNNSDKKVDNIRIISFLKYNGFTLTRLGTACCSQVTFSNKNTTGSQVLDLNKPTYSNSLNSGEGKEYSFKIGTDPWLIDSVINPNNIQLVVYFTGSTN